MVHSRKTHTVINLKRPFKVFAASLLCFVLLSASLVQPENQSFNTVQSGIVNDSIKTDSLIQWASQYLKKPYCYGANPPQCFDCSGLVNHVFKQFGVSLPNSSGAIATNGQFVSFNHARKGDLIFFNGRQANTETVGHVGIVTHMQSDTIFFIHASVQSGVIVSHTKEAYYSQRLLFVKRVKL
jgi:cell wall-associated NlpC family hydrolase